MNNSKPIHLVLSDSQLNIVRDKIRQQLSEYYDYIDNVSIAFGHFIDGLCLVYLHERQPNLEEECNYVERMCKARCAIDENGNFIQFIIDGKSFTGLEEDFFDIYRCSNIVGDEITTDDFEKWYSGEEVCLSSFLKVETSVLCEPEFDENGNDIGTEKYYIGEYYKSRQYVSLHELKSDKSTRYIIKNRYLLLCDNIKWHYCFSDCTGDCYNINSCPMKWNVCEYESIFERYGMESDAYKNRYGVYDLYNHRIAIHCGEMTYERAFIAGFLRIDFIQNKILTFDFLDNYNNVGIPFNPHIKVVYGDYIAVSVTERYFHYAQNEIFGYTNFGGKRSGVYAGKWYIFREGPYAGCTLYWMLRNNCRYVISLIRRGYIYFNGFSEYGMFGVDEIIQNRISLELDKKTLFEDIESADQHLCSVNPFCRQSERFPYTYWDYYSFEDIIRLDYKYLCSLLKCRSLFVNLDVIEELKKKHSGDKSYLKKLSRVEDEAVRYQVEYEEITRYNEYDSYIEGLSAEEEIEEANRQFNEMMDDFDAWGNID